MTSVQKKPWVHHILWSSSIIQLFLEKYFNSKHLFFFNPKCKVKYLLYISEYKKPKQFDLKYFLRDNWMIILGPATYSSNFFSTFSRSVHSFFTIWNSRLLNIIYLYEHKENIANQRCSRKLCHIELYSNWL